jgi:protein-tyrosine phosphatase
MSASILFVCLGNICRSPTAEGVLRQLAARENPPMEIVIDSAGTAGYHIGAAPDPRSQGAARRRGIDISGLRARRVEPSDYSKFDLILAMDRDNLRALQAARPDNARAQLRLFLEYAPQSGLSEVPDPYYGADRDFELVLDLCTAAARGLIDELQQRTQQPEQSGRQRDGHG